MKDLIWDNTLSVQIPEIDEDHQKLVNLFNILSHAVAKSDSTAYITAVLEELIFCTMWHFSHEERLMIKYNYDGYKEHRAEHQDLIASAQSLQQKFLLENKTISSEDINFLERWLTGHIFSTDMDLGNFLGEYM